MIKTILLSALIVMAMIVLSSSQIASAKKKNEVITKDTIATDAFADGRPGLSVGTMLLACGAIAEKNDSMSLKLIPNCNDIVKYIIDYCDVHMTDSKAKQSLQVCWEKDIMDSAFYYALRHLNVDLDISGKHGKLVANRLNSEMGFR
jgi:hypothetical protein